MTDVDISKYKMLDHVEHILCRPGMYLGSISNTTRTSWTIENGKMVEKELTYNPALLKMFDEIISNSVDEHLRSGKVKTIKVNLSPLLGEIEIVDDGGIPVQLHPEYNLYVPEMIFGHLMSGSNFDDNQREGAGMNGLGSKLTSIFSKSFLIETCDGKKKFTQEFTNNLKNKTTPSIISSNVNGTRIKFTPDYDRLGCVLDEGNIAKIIKRVYDVAGCNKGIKVYLDGKRIEVNNFESYIKMFSDNSVHEEQDGWEVGVSAVSDANFKQISFVNGVDTFNGGSHVEWVSSNICKAVQEFIKKKHKIEVKPGNIRQHLFLFIRASINAPTFTSQTKEYLSTDQKDFTTKYKPSDKFIKKLIESEIVQKVLDWAEAEKRRQDLAELRKLNKNTQNTNFLKKIVKFEDASEKDRSKCSLFLTEGDSAAKTILSTKKPNQGVYPLKGKFINVRDIEVKKLVTNEEFQNFMSIVGLKIGVKVNSLSELRFSRIVILSDNDPDGEHIAGLMYNMINEFWPELFTLGAVYRMITPLVIAEKAKKKFEFFSTNEYDDWAAQNPGHKSKYYKGVGTFMSADFKTFLNNEDDYILKISVEDQSDIDKLDVAFDKRKSDDRKLWLAGE